MSQHAALVSLSATYTDSDEDDEGVQAAEFGYEDNIPIQESTSSSHPSNSPQEEAQKVLVSYQDDLIDDEVICDVYTSDLNAGLVEGGHEGAVQNNKEAEGSISSSLDKRSLITSEPLAKCSFELQDKFSKMYEKKQKGGLDMNVAIQRNKNFRNPSIYEKLIKYCDIDELGSNYPKDVFDPHEWHESSYYDELAKAQKEVMEKRERERKDRTKVDFVSAIVKKPLPPNQETEPKRKSKWDQRGAMPPLLISTISTFTGQPPGLAVIPPFTNSASGTKSTVISAFGNIKKK